MPAQSARTGEPGATTKRLVVILLRHVSVPPGIARAVISSSYPAHMDSVPWSTQRSRTSDPAVFCPRRFGKVPVCTQLLNRFW